MEQLLAFCESERVWLRQAIERLVSLESPTLDAPAVDACRAEVERLLAAVGGRVRTVAGPDLVGHLVAEFGEGGRPILLLGHFDTVWPVGTLRQMPVVERDGRLFGPGILDMKSGIAIGMLALRAVASASTAPMPHIVFLLTADEETGSQTSRSLVEEEALRSEAVLVLEPALPDGSLKTARKGCGQFEITVGGVAAHAGIAPEKGANAILELCDQNPRGGTPAGYESGDLADGQPGLWRDAVQRGSGASGRHDRRPRLVYGRGGSGCRGAVQLAGQTAWDNRRGLGRNRTAAARAKPFGGLALRPCADGRPTARHRGVRRGHRRRFGREFHGRPRCSNVRRLRGHRRRRPRHARARRVGPAGAAGRALGGPDSGDLDGEAPSGR